MRRFLQQSNRSQPYSVTSEQVGTSADGTQEQQGQPQAVPSQDVYDLLLLTESALTRRNGRNQIAPIEAEQKPVPGVGGAERAFENPTSMSVLSTGAVDIIDDANVAFNEIRILTDTYAAPLRLFNQIAPRLANVHPYAQIALGILSAASQLLMNQVNLDMAVSSLLQTIRSVYEFLTEDIINSVDNMKDTLAKIARVISDSVQFIKDYSKTKKFWKRAGKNIGSKTQAIVDDYTTTLNDLMQQYRDRTVRDIQINVHRILGDLNLEGMAYAGGAGLDTAKICLDGTRIEVLRRIMNWIIDLHVDAPRIMWLQGQAGRGKSAIAHTIAAWIKNVGGLGSCFCFARDRLAERREEKILTTIARDLADRDSSLWVIPCILTNKVAVNRIHPFSFGDPLALVTKMGLGSRSVGSLFFWTNVQSMQDISAPESTRAVVLMTCSPVALVKTEMGIFITLSGREDTFTGEATYKIYCSGVPGVNSGSPFKNPFQGIWSI